MTINPSISRKGVRRFTYRQLVSIACLLIVVSGCAAIKPIREQNYTGDIHVQSLNVSFEKIDVSGISEEESGGLIAKLKRAQKLVQEIRNYVDRERSDKLNKQLIEFQKLYVSGLATRQGYPLVVEPDPTPKLKYDTDGELIGMEFTYPETSGATVDLNLSVSYYDKEILDVVAFDATVGTRRFKVKPALVSQINARNSQNDTFLRVTDSFRSRQKFVIANNFVIGLSPDALQDEKIYLLPVAQELNN